MLALTFALALLVLPPVDENCSLTRLEACRDTNELVWDPAFERAVETFLGRDKVRYLYEGRLSDQQLAVLGGPPDEPTRIGDLYRFTACRAHSCPEKGVAVLRPDGGIVALGILHSDCAELRHANGCYARNTLTVFVPRPDPSREVLDNLKTWAATEVAGGYNAPGMPVATFEGMEVLLVRDGRRTPIAP